MNVKALVELEEGRRRKAYRDTKGILTIGVGHNLDNPITDRAVDVILEDDLREVVGVLDAALAWWRQHDEVRQAVMVDLCFNMGIGRLLGFHRMLGAWQARRYDDAAAELARSAWAMQVDDDGVGGRFGRADRLFLMLKTGKECAR